jgi:6-pyruvoyltetrahydropterin/6-carboxytetrahydropterin synthase
MKPQGYGSAILTFKFEAAHRQPQLGGKCTNLHGHSWNVKVILFNRSAVGGIMPNGVSVEFGAVKDCIRRWINDYFDHATLLGAQDPLLIHLMEEDCKVFVFGDHDAGVTTYDHTTTMHAASDRQYNAIPWPSVEAVAFCLGERLQQALTAELGNYVIIESVMVSETETNSFVWSNPQTETDKDYSESHLTAIEPCA